MNLLLQIDVNGTMFPERLLGGDGKLERRPAVFTGDGNRRVIANRGQKRHEFQPVGVSETLEEKVLMILDDARGREAANWQIARFADHHGSPGAEDLRANIVAETGSPAVLDCGQRARGEA